MGEITVPPRIIERAAQPYVSITGLVTMQTIPEIADRMPEVFGWLAGRGVEPAGAPFFKFNLIDMERELEIEVGVPVAEALDGDDVVRPGCCRPVATRASATSATPKTSSTPRPGCSTGPPNRG